MSATNRRNPLLITVVVLAILSGAFLLFAALWTEKLWFDSVGYTLVFTTQLAALFLLAPASRWMTGQTIIMDGACEFV